jgi:hypothetical protein
MFKLKKVSRGIFEKECVVLDPGTGEPDAWLLIEGQLFRSGSFQELMPRFFRQKRQAEMTGINALLLRQRFCHQMGHELIPRESEGDGVARFPAQRTTKSIDIELFRRRYVVCRKSQVKECVLHGN